MINQFFLINRNRAFVPKRAVNPLGLINAVTFIIQMHPKYLVSDWLRPCATLGVTRELSFSGLILTYGSISSHCKGTASLFNSDPNGISLGDHTLTQSDETGLWKILLT